MVTRVFGTKCSFIILFYFGLTKTEYMYIWELGVTFFSYSVMKLYYLFLEAVKKTHLQKYQDPMSVSEGSQILRTEREQ